MVVEEAMVGGVVDVGVLVVCFGAAVDSFRTAVLDAQRG
jgi:hypothetical protein